MSTKKTGPAAHQGSKPAKGKEGTEKLRKAALAAIAARMDGKQAESKGGKAPKGKKAPKEAKPKRVSALDAAAIVLADAGPLDAQAMIEAMAARGLWSSPGGKTPHATLYAAITREISTKGDASRFAKAGRGIFSVVGGAA